MKVLHQTPLAFALAGFLLVPTSLQAQQLSQPASVLPWKALSVQTPQTIIDPTTVSRSDTPAWLVETAEQPIQIKTKQNNLPMVESESYSDLGQIRATPLPARPLASRSNNQANRLGRPLGFLRGLGIQATRPNQRR